MITRTDAQPAANDLSETAARFAVVLTMVLWGSQYPLTHDLSQRWDIFTQIIVRYPIGTVVLIGLVLAMGGRANLAKAHAPSLARRLTLGLFITIFAVFFTLGLAIGDPVTNAIVAASAPLTATLIAWGLDGQRPSRAHILALSLVLPGAVLASLGAGKPATGATMVVEGALLLVFGQLNWALYSLLAQRWMRGASQVAITAISFLYACPFAIATYVVADFAGLTRHDWVTSPLWDAALFTQLTFGALILGVVMWNLSVSRLGLTLTSLHLNLIPVVAIAVGLALGIRPGIGQLAGAALVIAGIGLGQWLGARQRRLAAGSP
ncbi:MAG: EamA family transporter [Rhizobiales bacterium]|nr:EamA family transporter [Hyphomicrobiales bacterium]